MQAQLYSLISSMVILIFVGFLLKRKNLITKEGQKSITELVIYAVMPCNILMAFSSEISDDIWVKFSTIVIITIIMQIISMTLAHFIYSKKPKGKKAVFQYAMICSNAGFIGNPVTHSLYGDTGLLYASIFLIPMRILMWTKGLSCFGDSENIKEVIKKVVKHPCMIATTIGLIIMFTPVAIPQILLSPIKTCSDSCTALTMIYIGTIVADVKFADMIDKEQIFYCFLRLIFLPFLIYLVCLTFNVDKDIMGVVVILTAMPAGSTTSLLASKYNGDTICATKCVVLSALLSIPTITFWSFILM